MCVVEVQLYITLAFLANVLLIFMISNVEIHLFILSLCLGILLAQLDSSLAYLLDLRENSSLMLSAVVHVEYYTPYARYKSTTYFRSWIWIILPQQYFGSLVSRSLIVIICIPTVVVIHHRTVLSVRGIN